MASNASVQAEIERLSAVVNNLKTSLDEYETLQEISVRRLRHVDMTKELEKADKYSKLLDVSIRTVPRGDAQNDFRKRSFELDEEMRAISKSLDMIKAEFDALEETKISDDAGREASTIDLERAPETQRDLVKYGEKVLKDLDRSVDQTVQIVIDTQNQAAKISTQLAIQTDQVMNVNKEIANVDGELERAMVVIKRMSRRGTTDKMLLVALCCMLLGILVVIILAAVGIHPTSSQDTLSTADANNAPGSNNIGF